MKPGDNGCEYCDGNTYEAEVKMCLWEDEEVFIIEDIPARICEKCYEQFYDDVTRLGIETLKRDGFPRLEAKRVMEVAVFSLPAIEMAEEGIEEGEEEELEDPAISAGLVY
jgi:YgiT-type zinc finger domain-containing protein